jgi:excisionase family DNA binding protein
MCNCGHRKADSMAEHRRPPMLGGELEKPPDLDRNIWSEGAETVTGAAHFLSCSRKHVFTLMKKQRLAWGRFGRSRRIPRRALMDLLSCDDD